MRHNRNTTILTVLAFGVFIAADDLTVVSTMLRQIIYDLGIPLPDGLDQAAWIVNVYLIAYVAVMPFIGRLSDIWGRRNVFVGALVLFLIGSIWAPIAPDFRTFLMARVLTAVGGGAMVPVAMAVIGDLYPAQRRASALGVLGAIDTAGWVWGPLYGALLVRFLTWQWQFYLNIPLAILGIILAWRTLADLPQPKQKPRIDWLGTAVLTTGIVCLNIGLLGTGDLQTAGSFTAVADTTINKSNVYLIFAAVAFIFFAVLQNELKDRLDVKALMKAARAKGRRRVGISPPPLIDLALFRQPNFAIAGIVNFLVGAVLIIAMVNVPLLVNILEPTPETAALRSGLLLSGLTAAMAAMAYVGGRLTDRIGYTIPAAIGLLLAASGFALMGFTWTDTSSNLMMVLQLALLGAGIGLVTTPVGTAVINAAPPDQRGIAASLVLVFRLIGMSVGLSALTSWGLQRFDVLRTQVDLPAITDPGYQQALLTGLTQTTVQVLTETFLISAAVAAVAILISLLLRRRPQTERGETAVS